MIAGCEIGDTLHILQYLLYLLEINFRLNLKVCFILFCRRNAGKEKLNAVLQLSRIKVICEGKQRTYNIIPLYTIFGVAIELRAGTKT